MKRLVPSLVLGLCLSLLSSLPSSAAVKKGDKCPKLKATAIASGKQYTCIKSGKKLVWSKGKKVKQVKQVKQVAPQVKPTRTPTPKPTSKFAYRDGGVRGKDLPKKSIEDAKYLANLGHNVPKSNPKFHILYGDIVTAEMKADYRQWMDILIENLGGYDRWVHAIYEKDSPSSQNKAVLDGLEKLGYFKYEFDGGTTPSIKAVQSRRGCLVAINYSGPNFVPYFYSFCNQPEHWSDPDRENDRKMMGSLFFSYAILHEFAHEYHHHVQRAHSLGKEGGGGNGPGSPIPPDGFAPAWWMEGTAGITPGWILRDYFDTLLLTKRLGLSLENISEKEESINRDLLGIYDCSDYTISRIQNAKPGVDGRRVTKAQEFYERQQLEHLGYQEVTPWSCLAAYLMHITSPQIALVSILEDQWRLGWHGSFKKHTGLTMDEFYLKFENEVMSIDLKKRDPLPSWAKLPKTKFKDTVDYRSIKSGPLNK